MKEQLKIRNFCGITDNVFTFSDFNILLGEQSVGKSITLKLLYYFKSFFSVEAICYESREAFYSGIEKNFYDIFICKDCKDTEITYTFCEKSICTDREKQTNRLCFASDNCHTITVKPNDIDRFITFSEELKNTIESFFNEVEAFNKDNFSAQAQFPDYYKSLIHEKLPAFSLFWQVYVPADRNIISRTGVGSTQLMSGSSDTFDFYHRFLQFLQRTLTLFYSDNKIKEGNLPITEYENFFSKILRGKVTLLQNEKKDFTLSITSEDGRNTRVEDASSGQQSVAPLLMALLAFSFFIYDKKYEAKKILYIEEPEAHLFPKSQKMLFDAFVLASKGMMDSGLINMNITTHSPYILSYVNNLLKKGKLINTDRLDEKEKEDIGNLYIDDTQFSAYFLKYDKNKVGVTPIFNSETSLIDENAISDVLDEINQEFDKILDMEYRDTK